MVVPKPHQPAVSPLNRPCFSGLQPYILSRFPEPLEHGAPGPAIRSFTGLEPAQVSTSLGDDEREPLVPVVILRRIPSDWIVMRVER